MFTLGNKEAIVNSTSQCVIPQTGLMPDGITPDYQMTVLGFGTFNANNLTDMDAQRYQAPVLEKLRFTCPTAAQLGIGATEVGVAVVVHLRVNSLRIASEFAIDFIKRGRPMILEIKVDGGMSAAQIAAIVLAAFNEYALKFLNITLPITAAVSGNDIILTATEGHFSINESVTFLKRGDIFAYNAVSTKAFVTNPLREVNGVVLAGDTVISLNSAVGLSVNDTIKFTADGGVTFSQEYKITEIVTSLNDITVTPAVPAIPDVAITDDVWTIVKGLEAVNDGKYLEENVRMSTPFTSDTYAIQPQTVPLIGAKYTMVSWTATESTVADGGWAGHRVTDIKSLEYAENRYTIYFNEAACLDTWGGPGVKGCDGLGTAGSNAPVDYILEWGLQNGATVTLADFKKANGGSAESVADFIA